MPRWVSPEGGGLSDIPFEGSLPYIQTFELNNSEILSFYPETLLAMYAIISKYDESIQHSEEAGTPNPKVSRPIDISRQSEQLTAWTPVFNQAITCGVI